MDGLMLLRRAHASGLSVEAEGDRLVIRGPRRADAMARLLLAHKSTVMAALRTDQRLPRAESELRARWDAAIWRTFYEDRAAGHQRDGGHSKAFANQLAWSEAESAWHMACGERTPRSECAGCGEPISGRRSLELPDGARVHFDEFECLIRYGDRWRDAATKALVAMGLTPPRGNK
jgi:hypothetical protein